MKSTGGVRVEGKMTEAERALMREELRTGLSGGQKRISSKYVYDERGSELFDRITDLPEYYLSRSERRLIESFARDWLRRINACTLVELGPGSGDKTRLLLDALPDGGVYVPVDISPSYLRQISAELGDDYPHLRIVAAHADMTRELALPRDLRRPLVIAFLGSTLGNFDEAATTALLRRTRAALESHDRFLLGVDLRKDRTVLQAAYNDAEGVTAEFNLNVLHVVNRELGADFDTGAFHHRAFYNEQLGRVEMHLESSRPQRVQVPGVGTFTFEEGETIQTAISRKYDEDGVRSMLAAAGLSLEDWVTDEGRYALAAAAPDVSAGD